MLEQSPIKLPEPWLRGTYSDLPVVVRAVVHALELAKEDMGRWCGDLTNEEMNARPLGLEPVSFQILHLVRSLDRLLTYAEGNQLSAKQMEQLKSEADGKATREAVFAELNTCFQAAMTRVAQFSDADLDDARGVGRKQLPTTVGGLLIHIAEHTQRHVGQVVTTTKAVRSITIDAVIET
jgi:uncharacterized damage-inducible protein DinB